MNPFELIRRVTADMDRTFGGFGAWRGSEAEEGAGWWPAIEVSERDGKLNVCAELPGLKQEDVKVEVTGDGLIIRGERKHEDERREGDFYRSERSYGQFYRFVPLPEGADTEKAQADFSNGELRVSVPVPPRQAARREIPVGSGRKENLSRNRGAA